jgi:hypothetical protein
VLDEYGVTFRVMKGYGSFTAVMQAAVDSNQHDKKAIVLYVGDWDPSGLHMSEVDLPERLKRYGSRWKLRRVALTRRDLRGLPGFDATDKRKDPRYRWFVEHHGRRCWGLDAMNPNVLRERVRKEIERYIDWTTWQQSEEIEQVEIASAEEFQAAWRERLEAN